MNYNVKDHGDILEHEATDFIRQHIPAYEEVWQTYIGNKGNAEIADIPGYLLEEKRSKFAEHSYTILEALYIAHTIMQEQIFEKPVTHFKEYIDVNLKLSSFIAQIGRVKDNLYRACLTLIDNDSCKKLEEELKGFFESRNIMLHGRKLPYSIDDLGLIRIPKIYRQSIHDFVWDDKANYWKDANSENTEYIQTTCEKILGDLLSLANKCYKNWLNVIQFELKQDNWKLTFFYETKNGATGDASSAKLPIATSSNDGRKGSGSFASDPNNATQK